MWLEYLQEFQQGTHHGVGVGGVVIHTTLITHPKTSLIVLQEQSPWRSFFRDMGCLWKMLSDSCGVQKIISIACIYILSTWRPQVCPCNSRKNLPPRMSTYLMGSPGDSRERSQVAATLTLIRFFLDTGDLGVGNI